MNERQRTKHAAAAPNERSARRARNRTADRRAVSASGTEGPAENKADLEKRCDEIIREILTSLRVPLACEDKRCRRAHRCVGTHRPGEVVLTVPCYDRHRDVLQPYFCRHVLPQLKAAQESEKELEDKF
jgi:hypothetical protein